MTLPPDLNLSSAGDLPICLIIDSISPIELSAFSAIDLLIGLSFNSGLPIGLSYFFASGLTPGLIGIGFASLCIFGSIGIGLTGVLSSFSYAPLIFSKSSLFNLLF